MPTVIQSDTTTCCRIEFYRFGVNKARIYGYHGYRVMWYVAASPHSQTILNNRNVELIFAHIGPTQGVDS